MAVQLVWLKRDLRVEDHRPLAEAARRGPVVCLYVYEPELLKAPEIDASHLAFVHQSLEELDRELRARGGRLVCRVGPVPEVFDRLHESLRFETLWSHEETGLGLTYARDRRVKTWCRRRGVRMVELPQFGVFRPLAERDGWARRWLARMNEPPTRAPERLETPAGLDPGRPHAPEELGMAPTARCRVQPGGMAAARDTLDGFLAQRHRGYRTGMSSPLDAWDACSRLSPYLAYGNLSLRQVFQATLRRAAQLRRREEAGRLDPEEREGMASLESFAQRLRWHCHFIQKLESEPEIEWRNMSRACDGLRQEHRDAWGPEERRRFEAWASGRTGFPLVDACMRCLESTGWINFRMRAMLVSFASYHLWLHWRPSAVHLARRFLDFEPGIHFPQVQMQSGTTGINAVRIYSPPKQQRDQDPRGEFVRRWVPELEGVPAEHLAEPQRMPALLQISSGCRIGRDYPAPIVEHARAYREAKRRMAELRQRGESRAEARRVQQRHGSRRRPGARASRLGA